MIFDRTPSQKAAGINLCQSCRFSQTNAISGLIPGDRRSDRRLNEPQILPLTGIGSESNHVLGHELAHVFHYNIIKESPAGIGGARRSLCGLSRDVGVSVDRIILPVDSNVDEDAVLSNDIPSFSQISRNTEYFPYRYGHAIWAISEELMVIT